MTQNKAARSGVCPLGVRILHRRSLAVKAKASRAARLRSARALTAKARRCFRS